jgi:S-adenosylmethionine decarboxylase
MMPSMTFHQSDYYAPGTHLLLDCYQASRLTECSFIEQTLRDAAQSCGATVLESRLHSFGDGQGVTGVLLLAESHISIHTWPEHDFAALDIFVCGGCDARAALPVLQEAFSPERIETQEISRGQLSRQQRYG